MRAGLQVRFSCGHKDRRAADFMMTSVDGQARFHRKVWRCDAEWSLCHDCFAAHLEKHPEVDLSCDQLFYPVETPRR